MPKSLGPYTSPTTITGPPEESRYVLQGEEGASVKLVKHGQHPDGYHWLLTVEYRRSGFLWWSAAPRQVTYYGDCTVWHNYDTGAMAWGLTEMFLIRQWHRLKYGRKAQA